MRVLIIDDEEINRVTLVDYLNETGRFDAAFCPSAEEALSCLKSQSFDIAIVDYKMPGMNGLEFLDISLGKYPEMDIAIMTAYGTIDVAVKAMKAGALDFIQKPFTAEALCIRLEQYARHKALIKENVQLKTELESRFCFHKMVGKSKDMEDLFTQARTFAESDSSVLIIGESGTGKGLLARGLHYSGKRKNEPFVEIHCGAIPGNILESEFFGHTKGAFTGAIRDREGKLEAARGGTVYLDDIDSMPLELQIKLLRVLQENEFERVGSNRTIKFKARIIASVKPGIAEKVWEEKFREDLYYRLNVLNILIPPLRERVEDIPPLLEFFLREHKTRIKSPVESFSPDAMRTIIEYPFPGNVRELDHLVERVLQLCMGKVVELSDLPAEICSPDMLNLNICMKQISKNDVSLNDLIEKVEKNLFTWALSKTSGNQSKAAKLLGVPRTTLQEKIKKYGIASKPEEK